MANGYEALGYALAGGYATDRENNRQAIQLQAAKLGMQFDDKGNLGYMSGSKEDLQAQEINMMKQNLQELESRYIKKDTWDSLEGSIKDGNYSQFNSFVNSSPKIKDMYAKMGVQSVEIFDPYNTEHLKAYQQSGFNPDVINYLTQAREGKIDGMSPEDVRTVAKSIGIAYPLVRSTDNSFKVTSLNDFAATTNILKEAKSDEKRRLFFDTIAQGQNALKGLTSRAYEASMQQQELANARTSITNTTEQLKLEDMQDYLENNPGASLADYVATMKAKTSDTGDTAEIKNLRFMSEQTGTPIADLIKQKQEAKDAQGIPASIKTDKYKQGQVNTIKQESEVENLYDVTYSKLSPENKTVFDGMVKEDAKNIKPEEYDALSTLQSAADKLNVEDLKNTTGIVDASFNKILDTLGMDLPDNELVQSANYNLIKNSIVKAAMGSQVTGNELERMTAQLGTEFKADKTVRIKMAETLDNLVAKYEGYKPIAPALYARSMKDKVNNMKAISNYLRNPEQGKSGTNKETQSTSKYKIGQVVTNTSTGKSYQFLGGDASNQKNWKEVK